MSINLVCVDKWNFMMDNVYFLTTPPVGRASRPSSLFTQRKSSTALLLLILVTGMLVFGGCGASSGARDNTQPSAEEAKRIAQEFQLDQDLAKTQSALDALNVANPRQWLMLQAETIIADGSDPAAAASMVKLTEALNIQSTVIRNYALQQGLVEPTPTFVLEDVSIAVTAQPGESAQVAAPSEETGADAVQASADTTEAEANAATTSLLTLATPTLEPTVAPTPPAVPQARSTGLVNIRSGPGTTFATVASLNPDDVVDLVGKTAAGDWWQVRTANGADGWVFAQLLTPSGDVSNVAVAADVPTPPTATPAPVADAAPTAAPAAEPTAAPATELTTTAVPAGSPNDQPYFRLVSSRMWSKAENGDCLGKHLLRIHVIDANGVRINGVRLKGIYTGEVMVTGSQGKGDGVIEYDLYGTGEGFTVIQNDDGREAASDRAEGFTTQSRDISQDLLIAGGYCTDTSDCQIFYDSWGCNGHHSWEATFQRNY